MIPFQRLFLFDFKRRMKSGFTLGYNIIFPIVMIWILGLLLSGNYTKKISGYEYYTLVMIPFCCTMAMITAAYAGKEESYAKTAYRYITAPISGYQIFGAKLLSCTIIFSICNLLVLLVGRLLWKIYLGGSILKLVALFTAEAFCVCAAGLYIGLGMKNFITLKNFLNLPIALFAILGGTFFPIGSLHPVLQILIKVSPLTWINRSIFLSIYDGKDVTLLITTIILSVAGILLTIVGMKSFKKEEFLNGDLPGYKE